jgi:hypothetical protein
MTAVARGAPSGEPSEPKGDNATPHNSTARELPWIPPDDGRTEPKPDSPLGICPKCGKPSYLSRLLAIYRQRSYPRAGGRNPDMPSPP